MEMHPNQENTATKQTEGATERPAREQIIQQEQDRRDELARIEKADVSERDAAIEKLRARIYGAGSEAFRKAMSERMRTGEAVALSEQERQELEKLQSHLRAAEAAKNVEKLSGTTDEELDAAFASAQGGAMEQRTATEEPMELDLEDVGRKQMEQEVDRAFEHIQQPPGQKAA
jgi:hypothetical protein